jgi:exopolysaccharide biosynthesis predicted pyruvyltransferase EpsI
MTTGDRQVIERLRRQAIEDIAESIQTTDVALLDVPLYLNPGDAAIYLGTRLALEKSGKRITYIANQRQVDFGQLDDLKSSTTFVFQGGGNFGDLWPGHQELREAVMRRYPETPIVQLPQSLHFDSASALASTRRAIGEHRDITLLFRDSRSYSAAGSWFAGARLTLTPDAAFALGDLSGAKQCVRRAGGALGTVLRADKESARRGRLAAAALGLEVEDWRFSPVLRGHRRLANWAADALRELNALGGGGSGAGRLVRIYDGFALALLRAAIRQLLWTDAVIVDRLHGHVLCTLLAQPHVYFDDRHGKTSALHQTWLKETSAGKSVDSVTDICSALELLMGRNL